MKVLFATCAMLAVLTSCVQSPGTAGDAARGDAPAAAGDRGGAAALFEEASSLARAREFAGAYDALEDSLHAGYPTPCDVLSSEELRPLLDNPQWRQKVFELLKANAREHSISMVRPNEPGEPMVLTVHIVGSHHEPPSAGDPAIRRAGVVVWLVHVDAAGYYRPWSKDESWNPRQFGVAVTDETGTVVVRTIRPGYYAPEYEAPDEPRHVHYNVEQNGVLLRAAEFFFEDDPRLVGEARRHAEENGVPIASAVRDDDGVWWAEVTIPVRGLR